ncbi:MAG: hypothetical protein CMC15_18600 [Flavobacteriaceae bacterium]|nr:hypothetical protein [Flavobacteriaceae bacterium]
MSKYTFNSFFPFTIYCPDGKVSGYAKTAQDAETVVNALNKVPDKPKNRRKDELVQKYAVLSHEQSQKSAVPSHEVPEVFKNNPNFKVRSLLFPIGAIIRTGQGTEDLMRVDQITQKLYLGANFKGVNVTCRHSDAIRPTTTDYKKWYNMIEDKFK